jgi:fibronectin type 3 domain-containing protein
VDTAGDVSGVSATIAATTEATVTPPTFVSAAATSVASALISWQGSTSALPIAQYVIYRGASATTLSRLTAVQGSKLSFTDTTVSSGVTYYYAVQGQDSGGNLSAVSAAASVTMPQHNGH